MKPATKRTLLIIGAVLAFIISVVLSLLAIFEISIEEYDEDYVLVSIVMLLAFMLIAASGFMVDTVSVKTRKISPKIAFIFTALLLFVYVFVYLITLFVTAEEIYELFDYSFYGRVHLEKYDGISIVYPLFTNIFGFFTGFFFSKLLATTPKGVRRTETENNSRAIDIQFNPQNNLPQRNSEDIIIAEPKKAVPKKKKEKKLSYLEEYKKEMYKK